jgi:3',5'-cyclic AMP phosphodiesterase CpdA
MKIFTKISLILILCSSCFFAQKAAYKTVNFSDTIKIAVISDAHYYDPTLGTTGKAFEAYLASDRKMIAESQALLNSAVSIIKSEKPNILLVTGDLTKDGEKVNHQQFAAYMKDLKNSGIKVYVIPGNHDVLNPDANKYVGDSAISIPNITAADFASIYSDCGFSEAIYKDTSSLSYIVEPVSGLWIFAMDACRYKENTTSAVTGGKFSTATFNWILSKLAEAKSKNKMVIGMLHHGVVEHYTGEATLFPDYVVADYKNVSNQLSANGMRYVFTGHYHAQDVTRNTFTGGNDIYDIETGSLVTYPSPVRIVKIAPNQNFDIYTNFIQTINYNTNGKTFPQYAKDYLLAGMQDLAYSLLTAPVSYGGYGVADSTAKVISPIVAAAFTAHYSGDEAPTASTLLTIQSLVSSSDPKTVMLGQAIYSLWTDLPPADNKLSIVSSTVPVELTSFAASLNGSDVTLRWSTATETNNKGFEIETKSGSGAWTSLGFVSGKGTTAVTSNYSFVNRPSVTGSIYYRLKQIDLDGSSTYSNAVEINNVVPAKFALSQNYPNPFNPSTSIAFSINQKSQVKLKITGILGNEIAELKNEVLEPGAYTVNFDASKLSSGVYFYSLITNSGSITKKMTLTK